MGSRARWVSSHSANLGLTARVTAILVPSLRTEYGCTAPEHRQFDFWVGEWEVTDSGGTTAIGANSVTREESGCLIHEHWRGGKGGTGQSFNFYDRQGRHWEQVWVASAGTVLHLTGGLSGK